MTRHSLPPIGHSIHGQTQATLMQLHQQSLERTLQSTITLVDADNNPIAAKQQQQRTHNKKKKKYYPWLQRDSLAQREKIGGEGSRRRQRHDNDKFVHHPFAVLYQTDLAFPGYGHDAPSFHWKYDSVIESLIRNNPPSSRRSKVANDATASERKSEVAASAAPQIGHRLLTRAQRKDIKKVHVPQGIVMQYEGELVNFLDQLTLSDDYDEVESEESKDESSIVDSLVSVPAAAAAAETEKAKQAQEEAELTHWVVVEKPAAIETKPAKEVLVEKKDETPAVAAAEEVQGEEEEEVEERPQVYLRWDIQDQFLRFVAHALVTFYGLVSFSKTAKDGKRWVYICHPSHLDSIYQLASPTPAATTSAVASTSERPQGPRRQKTLEHVQEMAVHELELLWNRIEPTKLMSKHCPRPDMTFFEYLYPATRPVF